MYGTKITYRINCLQKQEEFTKMQKTDKKPLLKHLQNNCCVNKLLKKQNNKNDNIDLIYNLEN